MENKLLFYFSLASSIIGLIIVYIVSQNIELTPTAINSITYDDVGKNVKVCGNITSLYVSKNNHVFLKVNDDSGKIDVVIFNSSVDKFRIKNLEKNDFVCISGKIDEYKNRLEIIPKEIRRE